MAKTFLVGKGVNQDGQGVVRLTHIWGIDLAGVASEDHLGTVANAGEDGLQRCWLQVLRFVNHHNLAMQ